MQGDQICEVNGQNVRECNQKDVTNIINNLEGEIVFLLGRNQALTNYIQEWSRKKAQMYWRNRTSTWSAYGGNKEKVQNQRPSLPAAKDQPYFAAKYSPDREYTPLTDFAAFLPPIKTVPTAINSESNDDAVYTCSRSSSVRSCLRLSVVIENNKSRDKMDDDEDEQLMCQSADKENRTVPSIEVTEF